jgi:DNA-binding MarR family transcriptional regulator
MTVERIIQNLMGEHESRERLEILTHERTIIKEQLDVKVEEIRQAACDGFDNGMKVSELRGYLGVSHKRVYQIIEEVRYARLIEKTKAEAEEWEKKVSLESQLTEYRAAVEAEKLSKPDTPEPHLTD